MYTYIMCVCVCACINTYILIYIYYTHTHTHTHTHTYQPPSAGSHRFSMSRLHEPGVAAHTALVRHALSFANLSTPVRTSCC